MKLDKDIEEWLTRAISEEYRDNIYTVERGIKQNITYKERKYINEQLNPLGFRVNCYPCTACEENSNGKHLFHLERVECRYRTFK